MKKKIFILLTLFTFLTVNYSCDDVLDRKPLDKISDTGVWSNESLLQSYVIDLYNRFPSFAYVDMFQFSDEATGSGGNSNAVTMGTMDKSNVPAEIEYWDYEFIRDCNIFLGKINQTPISDDIKHQLEGEVTVMRAVAYFEMAKRYGGVPLVTTVIDPYQTIPDDLKKRKKEVEIYDFVDNELTKAVQLLEKTIGKTPTARINKWTALALQSRANLWAASIAKYGKEELNGLVGVPASRANDFYKKASDGTSLVLNSGLYSLYNANADKAKNYQNIFLAEGNSEILFAKEYNGVEIKHTWDFWKAPARFASGQGSRCNPTLDLILQYENIDGSEEDYNKYFNQNYRYKSGLDIFRNKDPRLFATVLFQGSFFVNDLIQTYEGIDTAVVPNPVKIVNNPNLSYQGLKQVGVDSRLVIGDDKTTNSGFLIRKWCDEPKLPVPASSSQVDWPIIRLAEVYITKAEADFQLGKIAESVVSLNATRGRAGISPVTIGSINMQKIQNEWMAEFAFENKRYWDLRRWRIADSKLNKQFSGLKIIWHYASNQYYFLPLYCETANRVFRTEHYYNPITSTRINNNPLLLQNPLY